MRAERVADDLLRHHTIKMETPTTTYTCRICLEESSDASDFITPCACSGTMGHVHSACLEEWRRHSARTEWARRCRECGTPYRLRFLNSTVGTQDGGRGRYIEELHLLSVLAVFCNLGLHVIGSSSTMSDAVSIAASYVASVGTRIHTCGGPGAIANDHLSHCFAWTLHGGMLVGCIALAWNTAVAAMSPIPLLNLNWRRLRRHAAARQRLATPPPLNSVAMSIARDDAREGAEAS